MNDLNQDVKQCDFKYKVLKLHFLYVFTILILLLAFVMSDRWTESKDFTTYLTNVATFVSVVLGLVAIFYSFISNSSLSQSLGNISKVSDEVVQTKSQIETFLKHADELEQKGSENTNSLKEISNSVESHVASLREALGSITEKTQSLQDAVSGRFDKFENILAETSNAIATKPNNEMVVDIEGAANQKEFVERFLFTSSLIGIVVAYACVLSNRTKKNMSLEEISKIFLFDNSYMHGYYVAMVSAGLFTQTAVNDLNLTYMISNVDVTLEEQAKSALENKLESVYKKDSLDTFNKYQRDIAIMENSFEV